MAVLGVLSVLFHMFVLWIQAIVRVFIPAAKKSLKGQVVLITGAGHGIGRQLALEVARVAPQVKALILWDLNAENNNETAALVREMGIQTHTYTCDVSKSGDIHEVAENIRGGVGEVDVLINNAGILYGGALLDMQESHIRRTFEVNTLAHFWTIREFLPSMLEKNQGHIVTIASMSAKSGAAFLVDYSSSKYAVYGMTEALAEELRKTGKTGVKTTVVCPMFVNTGLCMFPKDKYGKILTPEETAAATVDGMLRDEEIVYVPGSMRFFLYITDMLPLRVNQYLKDSLGTGIDPQYHLTKKD